METIIAASITATGTIFAALAWKWVKPNHTGTLHQKLSRIEDKVDKHIEWHIGDNR